MKEWKSIVQDFIVKRADKIKQVTRPLHDRLGIGYFTYHQIDEEGNYTVLVDNPDYASFYVDHKVYLKDPFLTHFSNTHSGLFSFDQCCKKSFQSVVLKAKPIVPHLNRGLMLIKKGRSSVEFYGFAGGKKGSHFTSLFWNHSHLLHSFADHFRSEMSGILNEMIREQFSLLKLKGPSFNKKESIFPEIDRSGLAFMLISA